jgi:hypothetical protein
VEVFCDESECEFTSICGKEASVEAHIGVISLLRSRRQIFRTAWRGKGVSYPGLVELDEEVRKWFFEEYLPKGLSSGVIAIPRIEKVGGGLKSVPDALDRMSEGGVSGAKVVVILGDGGVRS